MKLFGEIKTLISKCLSSFDLISIANRSNASFTVPQMQAKIIDFASDRIAKSLSKINKEDVRSAYSTISSKLRKKPKEDLGKVSSSEEYCEMMKKEFTFPLDDVEKPKNVNNKKPEIVEAAAGATDEWNTDGKDFPLRFKLGNE